MTALLTTVVDQDGAALLVAVAFFVALMLSVAILRGEP